MAFTVEELKKKKVGVLMGGLSTERDVSLRSGKACLEALQQKGYVVARIDVQKDVAAHLAKEGIEVAFNALHGRWGEDGCIQGLLEAMFIPYTGSGVLASALGMDKTVSKAMFKALGLPVIDYVVFPPGRAASIGVADLPFGIPCVVKPSGEGSSVGVHLVKDAAKLSEAAQVLTRYPIAIQLRFLQTMREVASERNTTTFFPIPIDLVAPFLRGSSSPESGTP